jgi:hypothetical protein
MPDPSSTPAAGAVITVRAPGSCELELGLVRSVAQNELDVAAVSEDIRHATDAEPILSANIAGFPAAVFVDVHARVLLEQFDEILGIAPALDPSGVWTPDGLPVGPPVLAGTDQRLLIRDEINERWQPYREPVVALRATQTFGELLARARTTIGAELADIATSAAIEPSAVIALEHDHADTYTSVGPRGLAQLVRKLPMIFGTEARARLRGLLIAPGLSSAPQAVAHRTKPRPTPTSNVARDADRYITAVQSYLSD